MVRTITNLCFRPRSSWACSIRSRALKNSSTNIGKNYRQLQTLLAEHAALDTAETAREQELDLLRHQINEITAANLVAGEEEEIEKRYKLASNSKRLIELASAVANKLSEADDSVLSQLAETQRLLRELEKIDSSIGAIFVRARCQRGGAF